VAQWFRRWSDRILWGVDVVRVGPLSAKPAEWEELRSWLEACYDIEWRFFATDEEQNIGGTPVRGLALDAATLEKIMYANAARLYFSR